MIETKRLIFDSEDIGVYISGNGVYNAPERDYEMVSIPGKNGQLAIDHGRYENIEVTYPCFIWANTQQEFREKMKTIRAKLTSKLGYKRLEDTYHPDEYRMSIYKAGIEVDPVYYNRAGEFELTFDCKPQRFLKSGENQVTVANNGTISNPTLFESLPIMETQGAGTLTINNSTITITNTGKTILDSEMMEAYMEENGAIIPKNDSVSGEFPKLQSGANTVSRTGITSVKITPRWWTL